MDLILDRVRKTFKDTVVVDDVSLRMQSGLYGLLGSNGAGKTTLMRMICTILKPTEGTIYYEGRDVFEMNEKYRDVLGYLPQEFGFYPELTVKGYLKYISALKGLRQVIAKKRINELLELTGMQKNSSKKMVSTKEPTETHQYVWTDKKMKRNQVTLRNLKIKKVLVLL